MNSDVQEKQEIQALEGPKVDNQPVKVDNPPEQRTSLGKFAPGNKLSKGRKPGSKNKTTILRELMEDKTSRMLSKAGPKVLKVVIAAAKADGNSPAAKMIMDRIVPVRKASDENDGNAPVSIEINIGNLTRDNVGQVLSGEVVEEE